MKEVTVKKYKANLSVIPCKHFTSNPSNPFCPFGRDCFYSHKNPDGTEHVFTHGIDEMAARSAQRARMRAQRSRANAVLRVRAALDNVGRMLHDDFDAFAAAMRAEFGDLAGGFDDIDAWDDEEEDEDEDDDEDEDWDDEEEEDALTELADDEHDFLSSLWLAERASMNDSNIDWGTGGWGDSGWTEEDDNDIPPPLERVSASTTAPNNEEPDSSDWGLRPRPRVDFDYREPTLPYGDPSDDENDGDAAASSATERRNAGSASRSGDDWW